MGNDDVTIEFGADSIVVEVDGVRAEVRGIADVRHVKQAIAQHLLFTIANAPAARREEEERKRFAAKYGEQEGAATFGAIGNPGGDVNRAILSSRSRY